MEETIELKDLLLRGAFVEQLALIKELGEQRKMLVTMSEQLHTLTAKKLPIKKSKNK